MTGGPNTEGGGVSGVAPIWMGDPLDQIRRDAFTSAAIVVRGARDLDDAIDQLVSFGALDPRVNRA